MADGANVMDPNNDGKFYTCSDGKVTGSSQSCPDGSKFYQALADLPDKGCWDPTFIPVCIAKEANIVTLKGYYTLSTFISHLGHPSLGNKSMLNLRVGGPIYLK